MADEQKGSEWILNYVQNLIEEVKQYTKAQRDHVKFHQTMAVKHQTFFAKFPHLLTKICDDADEFDLGQLKEMLGQMEEIQRGEKDLGEVNKEMGQKFFDRFVLPHVDLEKENEARAKKGMAPMKGKPGKGK